jgi:hypothetical protein
MAKKQRRPTRPRPRGQAAKWTRISKVPFRSQFLYTFVYRDANNRVQAIQVVHTSDTAALRLAKRQAKPQGYAYAYAYAYAYDYVYGYDTHAHGFGYGIGESYGYGVYAR